MRQRNHTFPFSLVLSLALAAVVCALPCGATETAPEQGAGDEQAVHQLHKDYWTAPETQFEIVQNRAFVKRHAFELAVLGGPLLGSPFLRSGFLGGSLGFHFSELLSVHASAWKATVSDSSAMQVIQDRTGRPLAVDAPNSFYGLDLRANLFYGKLNAFGAAVIHFNYYLLAGAGNLSTQNGRSLAVLAGLAQQIHLSKLFAFNLDYRLVRYTERTLGNDTANFGQVTGTDSRLSSQFTVSVSAFLDPFGAPAKP